MVVGFAPTKIGSVVVPFPVGLTVVNVPVLISVQLLAYKTKTSELKFCNASFV